MTILELKQHLAMAELDFFYHGKLYFICSAGKGFEAGEAGETTDVYKNFSDLYNYFRVNGQPLKEILDEID